LLSSKPMDPNFFHFHTPWQPISINCTLHISFATRHNVQLISKILTCILSYTVDVCAFSAIIHFFSRTPKCPGSYPGGFAYSRLGITDLICTQAVRTWPRARPSIIQTSLIKE
jgi:hypothetical protein